MFAKSLEVHKEPCAVEIYKNIGMNATKTIVFAYVSVLSSDLMDGINSLLFDDMFSMISYRSNGKLVNMSLNEIINDEMNYNKLWEKVKKIKEECERI